MTAPEIPPGFEDVWAAFAELSTCRPVGMGVGPIPWTAIDAWGQRFGWTAFELERWTAIIRSMDAVYLASTGDKRSKRPTGRPAAVNAA